jgi:hypothetical protein
MNVLITVTTYLPFSSTPYAQGTVLEIPAEMYNENCMTRLGTQHPLLAGRIPWATLSPGAPPVIAQ